VPNAVGLFGLPQSFIQRRFQWELRSKGGQRTYPKDQSRMLQFGTLNLCAQKLGMTSDNHIKFAFSLHSQME
jgi:hypothetical protein